MAEMLSGGGQAGHAGVSRQLRAAHQGLFGHMSPEDLGAAVAGRAATVGTGWGQGRALERNGGTFDHAIGPAPARRDLRYAGQVQPPGESPLARYMRERD